MNNKVWDSIWMNSSIATMEEGPIPYGLVKKSAIATKDGKILWIKSMDDLTVEEKNSAIDLQGRCITPGLIDCHTHLIYAGNRCHEFTMRLAGKTYAEIAQAGGGIQETVRATRLATEEELFLQSAQRLQALLAEGVTTVEIKSGYGLDLATELKILKVARRMGIEFPVTIINTFLGAHALPPEFTGNADGYIDFLCEKILPEIAADNLADAVDIFCEKIAFNVAQAERVFKTAQKFGLPVKCHAEQLSNMGASQIAAKYHALSVEHLEYLTEADVQALARSGSVAVLLPGAFYFLSETQCPPIHWLRQYKVPMAIATDCNPGTSPVTSLVLMLNMACVLFKLTPEEALAGITRNAAKALGLAKSHGTLTVGKVADLVVWDVEHPMELAYHVGGVRPYKKIKNGIAV